MARVDSAAQGIASRRLWRRSRFPADTLDGDPKWRRNGREVAERTGLLLHYTTRPAWETMRRTGTVGMGSGVWLTPVVYSSCMAPFNLGVNGPISIALVIDPVGLPELLGPGTSRPSYRFVQEWAGGAIEFFSPGDITIEAVREVIQLEPCGDRHRT